MTLNEGQTWLEADVVYDYVLFTLKNIKEGTAQRVIVPRSVLLQTLTTASPYHRYPQIQIERQTGYVLPPDESKEPWEFRIYLERQLGSFIRVLVQASQIELLRESLEPHDA